MVAVHGSSSLSTYCGFVPAPSNLDAVAWRLLEISTYRHGIHGRRCAIGGAAGGAWFSAPAANRDGRGVVGWMDVCMYTTRLQRQLALGVALG